MHRVDENLRARRVRHIRCASDVGDGAESIRGGADRDQFGARIELPVEVVQIELSGFRNHLRHPHRDAAFLLQGAPGSNVGVVIQFRHDDFVAGFRRHVPTLARDGR